MSKYIFAFFAGMVDNLGVFEYQSHFSLCKGMPADYSGKNLRGRSFKGQDLTGANFSGADIRGADFTDTILIGANFSYAKAGLQKRWVASLLIVSFLLSGLLLGIFSAYIRGLINYIFNASNQSFQIAGWVTLVILTILLILIICQGFNSIFFGAFLGAVAVAGIGPVTGIEVGTFAGTFTLTVAGAFCGTFAFTVAFAIARAYAGVGTVACTVAFAVARTYAVAGSVVKAIVVAGVVSLFSTYITWLTLQGNEKYALIRKAAIAFAAFGGTKFCNANLTNANFTGTTLKSTNFRKATITRTCFHKAEKLDRVRPGETYLKQLELLPVLVTGIGADKNFDRQDLRGVNLQGANLTDASFIGADLSEADLQDADLSRAKLVQTQLNGTDFTGATLTGAYIEDWGMTNETKFDGVRCGYVFMRLPTKANPDPMRKPDNREEVFGDGGFGDFIKPIFDTLDLYHSQGVDPRAIATAFKELAENNPSAELEIVAIERRGDDKILLRSKTAATANKSALSKEYFLNYNQLKAFTEQEFKALITEKDNRISSLETMVFTTLQQPSFYSNMHIVKVDNMNNNPGGINQVAIDSQLGQGMQVAQDSSNPLFMNNKTYNTKYDQKGSQIGGIVDNAASGSNVQITQNNNTPLQQNNLASSEANNSPAKTILILAANPRNTTNLRLGEEVREIDAGLQRAKKRELFKLEQCWAVRVDDVYQALLKFKPQFVHFSGHGEGSGLILESDTGMFKLVETEALAKLFGLFANDIECVVLNACYSEAQAEDIVKHIPYVIGMNKQIGDKAAIKFATGFYSALSSGKSVEFAYELGCNVIQLDGIDEHLTPVIKKKQQSNG